MNCLNREILMKNSKTSRAIEPQMEWHQLAYFQLSKANTNTKLLIGFIYWKNNPKTKQIAFSSVWFRRRWIFSKILALSILWIMIIRFRSNKLHIYPKNRNKYINMNKNISHIHSETSEIDNLTNENSKQIKLSTILISNSLKFIKIPVFPEKQNQNTNPQTIT